jgi:hypothetical protein
MTVRAKPSKNGHAHQRNGRAPGKNGDTPRQSDEALLADPVLLAEALASGRTPTRSPPLDAVSTVDGSDPKPKPDGEKPAANGRAERGKFGPGNQFARGNANARKMAALRGALLEAATAERMVALGEKLFELAMAGDLAAAKLLLAYAVGKTPGAVDPDRLDLDEWSIANAMPTVGQFLRVFVDGLSIADALAYRRQAYNGVNEPRQLLEEFNEELSNQRDYGPLGLRTRQLHEARNAHNGK